MLTTAVFELVQQLYMLQKLVM